MQLLIKHPGSRRYRLKAVIYHPVCPRKSFNVLFASSRCRWAVLAPKEHPVHPAVPFAGYQQTQGEGFNPAPLLGADHSSLPVTHEQRDQRGRSRVVGA